MQFMGRTVVIPRRLRKKLISFGLLRGEKIWYNGKHKFIKSRWVEFAGEK